MAQTPLKSPWVDAYEGEVEAPYGAREEELLRDLYAVIEAVNLKPVRLTKSGIPPKPLWSAINQRLVWRDPAEVLYDWEEVDQVRFTYLLAGQLDLIRPDGELWLRTGPAADAFFTATPLVRARAVRRAYLGILDWDERCDARAEEGGRHNFGRAYRRDFVHDVMTLREIALGLLSRMPGQAWVRLHDLARDLSREVPDLLLSEVCELPAVAEEIDPEKLRFLVYWFTLLGRFGWADLGRVKGQAHRGSGRLCRLTPLGEALVHGAPLDPAPATLLGVSDDGRIEFATDPPRVQARYVARALGRAGTARRSRPVSFRIDAASLRDARAGGADLGRLRDWLRRHADPWPERLSQELDALADAPAAVRIVRSADAVEVDPADAERSAALRAAGFPLVEGVALAGGLAASDLFEAVGGEPFEGWEYPATEPWGVWKAGPAFQLLFSALPLQHRELLLALEPEGEPPKLRFTADRLARLARAGWDLEAVVTALTSLAGKRPSAKVMGQLRELTQSSG